MNVLGILFLLAVVAAVAVQMERTHRRTRHLPRITQLDRRDVPAWW